MATKIIIDLTGGEKPTFTLEKDGGEIVEQSALASTSPALSLQETPSVINMLEEPRLTPSVINMLEEPRLTKKSLSVPTEKAPSQGEEDASKLLCLGCQYNSLGQRAHMEEPHGCLSMSRYPTTRSWW